MLRQDGSDRTLILLELLLERRRVVWRRRAEADLPFNAPDHLHRKW
jgi:hypothetical protein